MNILAKRVVAAFIDTSLIAFLVAPLSFLFPQAWASYKQYAMVLVTVVLLCSRDLLFRNASLGKKILGIVILNDDWQPPQGLALIKRSFLTITMGYVLVWRAKFVDGNFMNVFDWEREILHTRVIEKDVFENILREIRSQGTITPQKLTDRYNQYLRNIYMN